LVAEPGFPVGSAIATGADAAGYPWNSTEPTCSHAYLWPAVRRILADGIAEGRAMRVFDLGCGNGAIARALVDEGWEVAGVDPSQEGIDYARASGLDLRVGSAYEDLAGRFGRWPFVVCLEVVEHVYFPHRLSRTLFEVCEPGARGRVHPFPRLLEEPGAQLGAGRVGSPPSSAERPWSHQILVRAHAARPPAARRLQSGTLQPSGPDRGAREVNDCGCG